MYNLPTLHFRRIHGDMIEVFKILSDKYDTAAAPVMDIYDLKTTRGNDFKLHKIRAKYDLRKYFFTNRLLTYGTVYLIMLLWQRVLIVLNHV